MLRRRVSAYPNVVFASSSADALAAPAIADWISVRQLPPLPAFKFRHTQTHFRPVIAMSSACIFVKKNLTFVIFDVTWCTNFNYFINLNFCVMENLLLQTKEYVKELMVYRFKSVIPSLEKTDNFPILVNDFMDKGILLWLWILPDGRAINQQKRFRYISEAFCLYRITFYMPHSRFCSIIHSTSISVTVYRIYFPLNKS